MTTMYVLSFSQTDVNTQGRAARRHIPEILYQRALQFWCDQLGASNLVKVIDYEEAVHDAIGAGGNTVRAIQYNEYLETLDKIYSGYFDPARLGQSLEEIASIGEEGQQIRYTFYSIVSSVYYQTDNISQSIEDDVDSEQELSPPIY